MREPRGLPRRERTRVAQSPRRTGQTWVAGRDLHELAKSQRSWQNPRAEGIPAMQTERGPSQGPGNGAKQQEIYSAEHESTLWALRWTLHCCVTSDK